MRAEDPPVRAEGPAVPEDLLSAVLAPVRLRGVYSSHWSVRAPWSVRGRREPCAVVHYLCEGSCAVSMPGRASPLWLGPGDLALFPHGAEHTLADAPATAAVPLEALLPGRRPGSVGRVSIDGPGEAARLLCGGLHYDEAAAPPLYRALPEVVVLEAAAVAGEPLLQAVLEWLSAGADRGAPGAELVELRAFETVFVLALRVAALRAGVSSPLLRALRHPGIARALLAVHTRFAEPWSLEALAAEAGMSRSAFASAFRGLVGETPGAHLLGRRMQEAARLLGETPVALSAVPERVGYGSTVGFHLAFRKRFGVTPGEYRRRCEGDGQDGGRERALPE
ncbi:AraC family transcriptional regulator [Nocardiopsis baichengensis]|uniref:AraC family transcriptional regulator n=1 Tax=Nocardiopsis baichengensis TaxID=280240 RepID=UPI00034B9E75|nr:AraC family transcriptional regulator [Nocardiopsis baichengensis]